MGSNELIISERKEALPVEPSLSVLKERMELLMQALHEVLEEGINRDYGVVPGTKSRMLYQSGAQKLMTLFKLVPTHEVEIIDLHHPQVEGHREYRTVVSLYSTNGVFLGKAPGSCNTMENKYRYRVQSVEMTSIPVPREYWEFKKKGDIAKATSLLGGPGRIAKKAEDGQWMVAIATGGEKIENDNPAEFYNTCEKMSYKRACVNIVKWVTAAGALFPASEEETETEMEKEKKPAKERRQKEPVNAPVAVEQAEEQVWNDPDFSSKIIKELESCPDSEKIHIRWKELWPSIAKSPDHRKLFEERDRIIARKEEATR